MNALRLIAGSVFLLLAHAGQAHAVASSREDPVAVAAAVRQAVAQTAPAHAALTLGSVAAARYMPDCTAPLHVTVSGLEPYQQAAVHCQKPIWTLYVDVTVDSLLAIVVAARPVAGGSTMTADDLTLQDEPLSLYAGRQVYYHTEDLIGATTVLSLPRGAIVTSTVVQKPVVVQAGQTIAVDVRNGAVDVTLDATAEQAGRVGDSIMVANPNTGKRFQATVTPQGAVIQLGP